MDKSFYPSCAAFVVFWLFLCKKKDSLPVRCSLLSLVPILQPPLHTFYLWREVLSGVHPTGLPRFGPLTPLSHQRGIRKREIAKTCPFWSFPLAGKYIHLFFFFPRSRTRKGALISSEIWRAQTRQDQAAASSLS